MLFIITMWLICMYLMIETVIIDGVCSWSPEEVYKFKTQMNRPKIKQI